MANSITQNRVKLQPCPHCGNKNETNYCYGFTADDGNLLSVCKRGAEPGDGWEKSNKKDKAGDPIYFLKRDKKFSGHKQEKTTHYIYPPLPDGRLVRVVRKDYSEDGRWKKKISQNSQDKRKDWHPSLQGIDYNTIPLYHADWLSEAVASGTPIFIVEGENKVEKLEAMGLTATCNIGGAGKWQISHSEFLKGANLILCPDRDKPGIKHVSQIHKDFPDAKFLYAYPDSPLWDHLPESGGCDIIDWIEEKKLTREDVLKSVVDRPKELKVKESRSDTLLSIDEVIAGIKACLDQNLTRSQWESKYHCWAKASGKTVSEIRELKKACEADNKESEGINLAVEDFVRNNHYRQKTLDVFEILPHPLAEALESRAKSIDQKSVRLLHSLWPVMGAILGSRFAVNLRTARNDRECWREYPIFYCADVDKPSGGKTTTQKQIYEALKDKDIAEQGRTKKADEKLKELKEDWAEMSKEDRKAHKEDSSKNPRLFEKEHCRPKRWIYNEGTLEAIMKTCSTQDSWQGGLWLSDELSGLFGGLDQYKGGKGNDRQRLLEAWNNPMQNTFDRVVKENRYHLNGQTLNILGGIQFGKVKKYLDLSDDVDGLVSRFHFLITERSEPKPGAPPIDENSVRELIERIFSKIDGISLQADENGITDPYNVWFSEKAEKFVWDLKYRYAVLADRNSVKNPSLSAYLGKQIKEFLRFALVIHVLNWVFDPEHTDLYKIPVQTAVKAAMVTDFYINQFLSLQGITGGNDQNPLQGILHEIWELAKSVGRVTTREIHQRFRSRKIEGAQMNSAIALQLMEQLQEAGYGRLEGKTLHYQEPQASVDTENFYVDIEPEFQQASEPETEIDTIPSPEPVTIQENDPPETDIYDTSISADGVHIDNLEDFERKQVLMRTTAPIDTGEVIVPTRAIARIINVIANEVGQWLVEAEAKLGETIVRFIAPFSDCCVDISS